MAWTIAGVIYLLGFVIAALLIALAGTVMPDEVKGRSSHVIAWALAAGVLWPVLLVLFLITWARRKLEART